MTRGTSHTRSICNNNVSRPGNTAKPIRTSNIHRYTHSNRRIRTRRRNSNPRRNRNARGGKYTASPRETSPARPIRMEPLVTIRHDPRRILKTRLPRSLPLIRYPPDPRSTPPRPQSIQTPFNWLLTFVDFSPSLSHAIHESLLRLKKEALEGNLPPFLNEAAYALDAGIRLDTETLCARWAPTLEILSRDEIERREGDRERQIRRLKRDTARFGGLGTFAPQLEEEILSSGRRRLKRKRSTSPTGRGTPRGPTSRADSPSVVDVSVARAASLTDKYFSSWEG